MYYHYWRHINRHQPMQPTVQPAQPHVGGTPTVSTLTQYLQQIIPQIAQQYAQPGTVYPIPVQTTVTVQGVSDRRNNLIRLYEENLVYWRQLLNTPAVGSGTMDVHEALKAREAANQYYQQWDANYKAMIREAEAQLTQMGSPVSAYQFSS